MQREHLDARAARDHEAGFTLIELMMVIFIIAILIAVLLPVFVSASNRARDRATQSSLHNAVTAAKSVFSDKADYTQATPGTLTTQTGAITFVSAATAPSGQNTVSVATVSASYIVFGGLSKSGECFYIADDASGTGTLYAKLGGAGGCAANGAPLPGDAAWQKTW
jgi:prepilin-type N-terminal cleavage/methylation domain-containing protein